MGENKLRSPPPHATLQFNELSLFIQNGGKQRRLLDKITGRFPHGQMHAIMGPSGCGKSSFMTALCGKVNYGITKGDVTMWMGKGVGQGTEHTFEEVR